jgi:hypothetical protein
LRRPEFEHVIAAAAEVSGENEFVVVGSQAILGGNPNPPEALLASMEADIYPRRDPEKAEEIDAALGDGSPFQRTFGYYAHGVGPETAKAPEGWEDRLVKTEIPPRPGSRRRVYAYCLEPNDLVLAKCAAGRDRDWEFARQSLEARIVSYDKLAASVNDLPLDRAGKDRVRRMLEGIKNQLGLTD